MYKPAICHGELLHFVLLHLHSELQSSLLFLQIHFLVAHFPLQEHEFSFSAAVCVKGKASLLKRLRIAATTSFFDGFCLPFKYISTKEDGSGGSIFSRVFLLSLEFCALINLNCITSSRITLIYPKNTAWDL